MKKETLEEFMATLPYYGHCNYEHLEGIEVGAKWQAERMYSEEEVLQLLLRLQQTESYDNLYEWFEKFKKK